jgi:hypothetical protein
VESAVHEMMLQVPKRPLLLASLEHVQPSSVLPSRHIDICVEAVRAVKWTPLLSHQVSALH